MAPNKEYLSVAETAKLVRAALKKSFPGVKFSVRSSSYAGGASITVGWTDGPTGKEVKAVTSAFEGSGFDGMIDLKYPYSHWLLPDGTTVLHRTYGHSYDDATHTPEKPHPDATLVHFGADYIFENRKLSAALATKVASEVIAAAGLDLDPASVVKTSSDGDSYWHDPANTRVWNDWLTTILHRAAVGIRGDGSRTHDLHGFELREEELAS